MEKVAKRNHLKQLSFMLIMVIELSLFLLSVSSQEIPSRKILKQDTNSNAVRLETSNPDTVIVDNGLVQVTFENPSGYLIGIKHGNLDNVLETKNKHSNRGYWDLVWGDNSTYDKMETEHFNVITQTDDLVEISFNKTWNSHDRNSAPLNIDKRFIVRRGVPGIYAYAILEREQNFPSAEMYQIRLAFKLLGDKFHYMALSDTRQRVMPTGVDRNTDRSQVLAFKEAVLLTNPINPDLRGEVDDKYQYSRENKDNKLHGWISDSDKEDRSAVGFWIITPSNEFIAGGPHKQELTSHVGPTALAMFSSTHYAGRDMDTYYEQGKHWKKVLGPVLIYLNSASTKDSDVRKTLWEDAKQQSSKEVASWPYNFIRSDDYPSAQGRRTVRGQLIVRDRYMKNKLMQAHSAFVGLAPPGEAGSWQENAKGYQFWTQTDRKGRFEINHVRPGDYNLYAWVHGFIGDFKLDLNIRIKPGNKMELGTIVYDPPRNGPTLWEIGVPDRKAAEFFIPDPYPSLMNPICNAPEDRYRQYGLWDRYSDIYRHGDVVYTVGKSNHSKDWFFAHVLRHTGKNTREPTTWQIKFNLDNVNDTRNYTLQLALASATFAEIQVRFNDPYSLEYFSTRLIGSDNAIARHGIHGLYRLYSIIVPGYRFRKGQNTIFLTQTRDAGTFSGVMYDYIRLEGPAV